MCVLLPERPENTGQTRQQIPVAALDQPGESSTQAGVLPFQRLQPDGGIGLCHVWSGALREGQGPRGMPFPSHCFPSTLRQPLPGELADRLQHAVAWLAARLSFVDDEALGDEGGEEIEGVGCWLSSVSSTLAPHTLCILKGEAAGKDSQEL